jgi:hypothetical protein
VAGRPVETDTPVFDWTPVPDAADYRVQLANSEAFDVVHHDELAERRTKLSLDSVLPDESTTVYWRVRAEGENDEWSEWSSPAHFAVSETELAAEEGLRVDAPPVPLHPDGPPPSAVEATAVPFAWEDVPEASGYQLQVASTEDFEDPELDLTVDRTTSVTLYEELPDEAATLYWRIRPLFRVAGSGPWSPPLSFPVAPPSEEEEFVRQAEAPRNTARAAGPVEQARTSGAFSLVVSLLAVSSFIVIILLISIAA